MDEKLLDYMWEQLSIERKTRSAQTADLRVQTEAAGSTFSFVQSTLANAPLAADGMVTFATRFITNGRKSGEGAGLGTGVPAFYNPTTDTWKRFSDDADVTV